MFKLLLCEIGYRTGLFALLRWLHWLRGRRLTILMFHRVGYADPSGKNGLPTLFITPETFGKVLAFIKKRYRVTTFAGLARSGVPSRNILIITFDDGYRDVLTRGVPLLRREGLPFTLFLPAGLLRGPVDFWWDTAYRFFCVVPPHQLLALVRENGIAKPFAGTVSQVLADPRLSPEQRAIRLTSLAGTLPASARRRFLQALAALQNENHGHADSEEVMNPAEIHSLAGAADAEIGSHTVSHCFLDTVAAAAAREEVHTSRRLLQALPGAEVLSFAYPAGRWTPEVRQAVAAAGYQFACTTREGVNGSSDDPLLLRRINLSESLLTDRSGRFRPALLAARLVLTDVFTLFRKEFPVNRGRE